MTIRRLLPALLLLLWGGVDAPAQEARLRVDINIPENRLVVFQGGEQIRSYPISVGVPGHDTPDGVFTIDHAEWNPWWRPPAREWARGEKDTPPGPRNPMGRVKLFFEPLYFIHGTPDTGNIGMPASHGCVRMLNKDVIELARLLHERAAPGVSEKDIDRILTNSRATRRVNFKTPIDLVIRYDPVVIADGVVRVYPDIYKRNAVHSEAVYQALLAAGYDPARVGGEQVSALVKQAAGHKGVLTVKLEDAFGGGLTALAD